MARDICLFLYDQTNFLTLSSLLEAFSALEHVQTYDKITGYNLVICSLEGGDVKGTYGRSIKTSSIKSYEGAHWDTFIMCGGWGFNDAVHKPGLIDCLSEHGRKSRRLCILGGGVFVAAAAGLLNGCRVAAHPIIARTLAEKFPHLDFDSRTLLIKDGNVITSPGMAAAADLVLSLIESDYSYKTAVEVTKFLVVYNKRSFGDQQVSNDLVMQEKSDRFGPLHDWIRSNLRRNLSLETLADQAGMSVRNFTRVYHKHMGISPRKVVEIFRIYAACKALVLGKEQMSTIAQHCGFDTERTFLRAFTRIIGMSPSLFRERAVSPASTGGDTDALDPQSIDLNELFRRAGADVTPEQSAIKYKPGLHKRRHRGNRRHISSEIRA